MYEEAGSEEDAGEHLRGVNVLLNTTLYILCLYHRDVCPPPLGKIIIHKLNIRLHNAVKIYNIVVYILSYDSICLVCLRN